MSVIEIFRQRGCRDSIRVLTKCYDPRGSSAALIHIVEDAVRPQTWAVVPATVLALALAACSKSSETRKKNSDQSNANSTAQANSPAGQSGSGPGINLNCIVDHIQNPTDSFHYTYKKDSSSQSSGGHYTADHRWFPR